MLFAKNWIFDLDGTLTKPILDFPKIKRRLGLPSDRGILETLKLMEPDRADQVSKALAAIELEMAGKAVAAAGALELVSHLHACGCPLGILTRNTKGIALRTLQVTGMRAFFMEQYVLGRDEAAHKPSPDGILKLLQAWRALASESVMVGDYLFDLQAGKAAGTRCIYVDVQGLFPFRQHADLALMSLSEMVQGHPPP